jgi:hypothetical protein
MLKKKVLLYGNSILMAGLAASLQTLPQLDVIQMDNHAPIVVEQAQPLVFMDLRDTSSIHALPALCALPGVTLVGMDSVTGTFSVLTGESHPARSVQEVLDWLQEST